MSVIDKNVVYTALSGVNPRAEDDDTPWKLLSHVGEVCSKVYLTPEMYAGYLGLAWDRSRRGEWGPLCQGLTMLMSNWLETEKLVLKALSELPLLPVGSRVKDDDVEPVRAALGTASLLVSYDERLVSQAQKDGVTVVLPAEAILRIRKGVPEIL